MTEYPILIGECPSCIEEAGFKYEKTVKGLRGDVNLYRCDNCNGLSQLEMIELHNKDLGGLVVQPKDILL